jgi:uncharacterized protein (TIGR02646 family)
VRFFQKEHEPRTITDTKCAGTTNLDTTKSARAAFDQIDKRAARKQLAREQGWLCAFCMRQIDEEFKDELGQFVMKIAHRVPIDAESQRALDWSNLLGSCDGGQRSNGRHETCDLLQKNEPISVDPTQRASVQRLHFKRRDAKPGLFISSDDATLAHDVEQTLGLNGGDLPELRETIWRAFLSAIQKKYPKAHWDSATRAKFFEDWKYAAGSKLRPFLGVVEERLSRQSRSK